MAPIANEEGERMTGPSAAQAETVLNGKLGELLIARHPRWNERNVFIDSTQVST